ncbi:phenylpyruvate tautomerase MIF-related protein [Vulcanococcus sp.]|uniref:phenylpyruvate tautomerase MIF-related protein n=1 Tax=Vulcanococcus sp. TaxID=2856995 RepID=UPI003F6A0392
MENAQGLLKEISSALAQQTVKPEPSVMTMLDTAVPMTFGSGSEPSVFVQLKSIGALSPAAMSAALCNLISLLPAGCAVAHQAGVVCSPLR